MQGVSYLFLEASVYTRVVAERRPSEGVRADHFKTLGVDMSRRLARSAATYCNIGIPSAMLQKQSPCVLNKE
jgi:hypothetical protein